jgi:hypothetical protein
VVSTIRLRALQGSTRRRTSPRASSAASPRAERGAVDREQPAQVVGAEGRQQGDLVEETRLRERQRRAQVALPEQPDAAGEEPVEAAQAVELIGHG